MIVAKPFERKISFGMAVACIGLSACGNPYRLNYVSVLDQLPATPSFAPSSGTPRMVEAKNPREDVIRLVEEGYVPVGYVKFNSVKADEKSALSQAKEIGADVVLSTNGSRAGNGGSGAGARSITTEAKP
ncbi:MAG: hypothetical protein IPN19_01355 [Elusimicrobia bacterium]|nr:hypothetical protein [Elusimicrobiota bacterium]